MEQLQAQLVELVMRITPQEGLHATAIPGVHCVRSSQTQKRSKRLWPARLGIVVQGCKEIVLGRRIYRFDACWYTAAPIDLPVISRIANATADQPFLALLIDLDPLVLSELTLQLESAPVTTTRPLRALFGGEADHAMLEAVVRLAKLGQTGSDARILGPLVIKEILYRLLTGPDGAAISAFVRSDSAWHRIFQIIYRMKSALSEDVDVNALAKAARMSRSGLLSCLS